MQQAPRDLVPSRGSHTAEFDKKTGDLIVDFKDRLIDEQAIADNLKWCRGEHGEALTHLTLLICADAMQEYGLWLINYGFERQPDIPQSAMYRWRRELPKRRKRKEGK